MKLEYPKITGNDPVKMLGQVRGWLYTLVDVLNMQDNAKTETAAQANQNPGNTPQIQSSPVGSFNAIKSLIIKSAEIVDAYTVAIGDGLSGRYVAEAVFPEGSAQFIQQTSANIAQSTTDISVLFDNYQSIVSDIEDMRGEMITNAYIKAGELFTADDEFVELMDLPESDGLIPGMPVYGVAVGQTTNAFKAFARFTSFGLLFYDKDDNLVAYITKREMRIRRVRILESLQRGGYIETIQADGGSIETWEWDEA